MPTLIHVFFMNSMIIVKLVPLFHPLIILITIMTLLSIIHISIIGLLIIVHSFFNLLFEDYYLALIFKVLYL
jgi:hypothetical protein